MYSISSASSNFNCNLTDNDHNSTDNNIKRKNFDDDNDQDREEVFKLRRKNSELEYRLNYIDSRANHTNRHHAVLLYTYKMHYRLL